MDEGGMVGIDMLVVFVVVVADGEKIGWMGMENLGKIFVIDAAIEWNVTRYKSKNFIWSRYNKLQSL